MIKQEIIKLEYEKLKEKSIAHVFRNGKADIINNPRYATGIGIIKYVIENKEMLNEQLEINNNNNSSINTFINKIKNVFKKIN